MGNTESERRVVARFIRFFCDFLLRFGVSLRIYHKLVSAFVVFNSVLSKAVVCVLSYNSTLIPSFVQRVGKERAVDDVYCEPTENTLEGLSIQAYRLIGI